MKKKFKIIKTEDLHYLKSLKGFIFLAVLLFIAATITGFSSANLQPELYNKTTASMGGLAEILTGLNAYEFLILIFLNNSLKIIAVALLGILFGLVPILFLIVNGFLVGLVAQTIQATNGWMFFWAGILPHGIFEIPVLLIAAAVGLHLGNIFWNNFRKREFNLLKAEFAKAFYFSLRFFLPVLFFAAFIEVFVSKWLMNLVS